MRQGTFRLLPEQGLRAVDPERGVRAVDPQQGLTASEERMLDDAARKHSLTADEKKLARQIYLEKRGAGGVRTAAEGDDERRTGVPLSPSEDEKFFAGMGRAMGCTTEEARAKYLAVKAQRLASMGKGGAGAGGDMSTGPGAASRSAGGTRALSELTEVEQEVIRGRAVESGQSFDDLAERYGRFKRKIGQR